MYRGHSNVQGVGESAIRQNALRNNSMGEFLRLRSHLKKNEALQEGEALPGQVRVTLTRLIEDELRGDYLEVPAPLPPPLRGNLLASGDDQVSTRPRREIADEGRFYVGSLHHPSTLTSPAPAA